MSAASSHRRPVTGWQRTLVIAIDKTVLVSARNWAAIVLLVAGLWSGLPFLAPVAMKLA